ncbi:MAG: hypothetical protein ABIP94_12825 [Planctomycetota bacterium]
MPKPSWLLSEIWLLGGIWLLGLIGPLASASCVASPSPAALVLHWRIEPDGAGGELCLWGDGFGMLARRPSEGAGQVMRRLILRATPARAAAVASLAAKLTEQPRWLHVSGTFAGPRVQWERNGHIVHESSGAIAAPLVALVAELASTDAQLACAMAPVLVAAPVSAPRFVFSPGFDQDQLAAILEVNGSDVELRHLAARIAIDERAFVLVPRLRDAFLRTRAADGLGDYFLASALLRLGDPVGIARVVDVKDSSRPDWAAEAWSDLTACLPPDATASSTGVLDWFEAHGGRLRFDQQSALYSIEAK